MAAPTWLSFPSSSINFWGCLTLCFFADRLVSLFHYLFFYFYYIFLAMETTAATPQKRFREYGFDPGILSPGTMNSIADVSGVRVGHATKISGDDVRTGVTIVDPGASDMFRAKLPAAVAVGNGYGKLVGVSQIEELGTLETPITLTNTLAVGPVARAVVDWVINHTKDIAPDETINAVVGETNDGYLNAIHKNSITDADVRTAFDSLSSSVGIGNVGAGTGTRAFSWKGGIGTSSRRVPLSNTAYTLGVLTQTNFGGALQIMGVPVGRLLGMTDFDSFLPVSGGDGSCMIVIATDAPLSSRQLGRIARRAFLGLARTGSVLSHGSGDYAIAFSTSRAGLEGSAGSLTSCLADKDLTPFFLAAVETVEESVYDALFAAQTLSGRDGHIREALPKERVVAFLRKRLPS